MIIILDLIKLIELYIHTITKNSIQYTKTSNSFEHWTSCTWCPLGTIINTWRRIMLYDFFFWWIMSWLSAHFLKLLTHPPSHSDNHHHVFHISTFSPTTRPFAPRISCSLLFSLYHNPSNWDSHETVEEWLWRICYKCDLCKN